MAWTEPVTERSDGSAIMSYLDMNRITQNIAYLQTQVDGSSTMSKTSWSRNDILDVSIWTEIKTATSALCSSAGVTYDTVTDDMDYDNINTLEADLLAVYEAINA